MANTFPFFDADKMKEMFSFEASKFQDMFKMPEMGKMFDGSKFPAMDFDKMVQAQQKNVTALVEANKVAVAGYQDLYKKQMALFEATLAATKDQMADLQGQPLTAESASKSVEQLKAAFEKALADVKELAEMAQKANVGAFDIVKARMDEVMAELKAATAA